jgi:long-chain acyl-CoA synthetase
MSQTGGTAMSGITTISGPPLEPRMKELSGETLNELLDRAVARTPDSTALVIRRDLRDERWTYRQLAATVGRVAARLRAAGIGPGDRVLTWSQNDPWLVAAYFAVWRLGAVIVPLDLRMQTDVAIRVGRRVRTSLLLAGPDVDREVAAELDLDILGVDESSLDPPPEREGPIPAFPTVTPDDLAEVIFTSGTTSDPKGVMLTHGQIIHTARAFGQTGMGKRPDRALAAIPLSHMYGQTLPLLMGFMGGSTLVFLHSLSPKAMSATLRRERVTAVTLVPHLMGNLLRGIEAEARRQGREKTLARGHTVARWLPRPVRRTVFRSVLAPLGGALEVISCGGALLPESLQQAFEDFGISVVQGYGTTEVAGVTGHKRTQQRAGTVGPPLAGLEVRIADDGELLARGPNVMLGYWEAPEATAEVLDADGWFHTGDAARIDERGELIILGRTRDRIALPSGLNVYPEDVEAALISTGVVRGAVVVETAPGKLAAAVVPVDARAADEELAAAVKAANGTLAAHQRVGSWRRWPDDDLPRTHTQKVRRAPVQAWFARPPSEPAAPAEAAPRPATGSAVSEEAIAAVVAGVLADARGEAPAALSGATTLESLGLDSLTVVSLALRLEADFDAPLSDDDVVRATDIAALHTMVLQRQGQEPEPPPSDWAFSPPARAVRRALDATFTGWAVDIVAGLRVEGREHLADVAGPALICPNHSSHLDAPVVRAALPAAMRDQCAIAAAADYWFGGPVVGSAVGLALGAIPFGRTSDVRASLEHVAELVNRGHTVIVFPEGTRSADGRLGPLRQGIGLLAAQLRAPIVPVGIEGTHQILPKGSSLPTHRRRRQVVVRFGAPLRFGQEMAVPEATARVHRAIEALQPEGATP